MKPMRVWPALAMLVLLSACVSQPARSPVPVDPALARQNDLQRGSVSAWRLSGRVAVSNGSQGGSGRIDWEQQGDRYTISLSAPVTRQGWRLTGDAAGARLEGVEGGPRVSQDVEGMLFAAAGWEIPVRQMVAWVRGVGATDGITAPARVSHGNGNVPATIEQIGWRIDYREWHPATATQPSLPRRIEAARGSAKVRLIVDQWHVESTVAQEPGFEADTPETELARTLAGLNLDDPSEDMRAHVRSGDLRPVGVCGFACLAPGYGTEARQAELRIIDGTGDVVMGDGHLALKHRAEAYAREYNEALWNRHRANLGGPAADTGD